MMGATKTKQSAKGLHTQVLHALRDPFVWEEGDREEATIACSVDDRVLEWVFTYPEPPAAVREEIRHAHHMRIRTRQASRHQAAELLALEPRAWRQHLAEHPEMLNAGVVDALLDSADSIKHLPIRMHELTALATEIVEKGGLAEAAPIADRWSSGRAWRYHAVALDGLTRYRDALQACERAERSLLTLTAADHELAIVRYIRATLLTRLEELDPALHLVRDAARVFGTYSDKKMYIKARTIEGYVLHRAGRTDETLALWTSLIAEARAIGDLETVASLYCNVGDELRRKGDLSRATWYLRQAIVMFTRCGMFSDLPRPRLTLAHILVQDGDFKGALSALGKVYDEFTALGMHLAAANAQLEIVEILLVLGEVQEAKRLCIDLPDLYLSAGLMQNVQVAGAYLRECAELGDVRVTDVQHVRLYVQDLPQNPTRAFVRAGRRAGR